MKIVDGTAIAAKIFSETKARATKLARKGIRPGLAVVLIGNDAASVAYVGKKKQAAEKIGVNFFLYRYPSSITKIKLISEIKRIQNNTKVHGVIVQLPVPERLWKNIREILDTIKDEVDVDCLKSSSQEKLQSGDEVFIPPTPGAILEILKTYKVSLKSKIVCIIGRGELIGKPMAAILSHYPVEVQVVGRSTKNPESIIRKADIIISGVGKKNLLKGSSVKKDAVVIDAATVYEGKRLYGDVEFASVSKKASVITPVPGGVGPITVAKLLENVIMAAEKIKLKKK